MNAKLANGAKIIAMGPYRADSSRIVLAEYLGKYVTWRAYKHFYPDIRQAPIETVYDCFWGKYHSDLASAEDCFYSRIAS